MSAASDYITIKDDVILSLSVAVELRAFPDFSWSRDAVFNSIRCSYHHRILFIPCEIPEYKVLFRSERFDI